VLNAKYHEREASMVAQAGQKGQVTIATNMAGRGTDIILGGNLDHSIKDILKKNNLSIEDDNYKEEYQRLYDTQGIKFKEAHDQVVKLGGLHVIGTQRHEARRIDNQLRGRSGRQGDPGGSRFYVSLEDDLMRLFGSEKIYMLMERFGFPEDQPIEHPLINRSMQIAQKRVEGHNFEIRKQLLQYDNVMNKQREVIYQQRREILEKASIKEDIFTMIDEVIVKNVPLYFQEELDILGLDHWIRTKFGIDLSFHQQERKDHLTAQEVISILQKTLREVYQLREKEHGLQEVGQMEKMLTLWIVDSRWKEHLLIMDSLKEGIHLRGYAHVDPLVEYQKETYFAFQEMLTSIKEGVVEALFRTQASLRQESEGVFVQSPKSFIHSQYSPLQQQSSDQGQEKQPPVYTGKKVGRNDPCPCGSGKK